QRGTLWLLVACGCIGFIEPSPYEVAFLLAFGVYALCGIRFSQKLLPMAVLLLLYNIGGTFSLIPWMDEPASVRFMAVSVYLMITSVFFAAIMADDPLGRLDTMRKGYLMAAWVAGTAGIIGYFNIGGSGSFLALYGRASGTFKDPNVLGPFLVLPIVYLIQGILVGRISLLRGFLFMSIPLFGLFLTFSRGAWGNLVLATALMMLLMFLTSPNANRRARIILISLACVLGIVAALGVALSFEGIRVIFEERASLEQSYDLGVTGRFGNQLRSIPLMLDNPNGLGPLRFRWHFPEDPHNVYINAFASYGWLGGISYAALTVATCYVGWRTVFQRTPWQNHAIAIWSVLFITILQGMQIDTDHWRHVYLLLGLTWGLASLPADHPPRA
ncbi:MAG: O-antigen ligase family protein, partial [Bosea sp. (in: a-proteobacteria)]